MSKKISRLARVLLAVTHPDITNVKVEMKRFPYDGCILYRLNCPKKDFNLEVTLTAFDTNIQDPTVLGSLTFGQSFDNDYVDLTFKEFKTILKKVDKNISI